PVGPSRLQPNVPRDLQTICLKCLAKEPSRRYASALALAEDLRRFLECRPILARPVSRRERFSRWCRRNPLIAGLTFLAAVLLVVIAVGALISNFMLGTRLQRAEAAEQAGQRRLFDALVEKARAIRFSRRQGQRFDGLQAVSEAAAIARRLQL